MVLSSSASRIVARFVYDPYGERHSTPEIDERFGYIGEEGVGCRIQEVVQMGARFYETSSGRFISMDPLRCRGGAAIVDAYVYVENNPALNTDPRGLILGSTASAPQKDYCTGVSDTPGGYDFSLACKRHDGCYSDTTKTKKECDDSFRRDMETICNVGHGGSPECRDYAGLYGDGVSLLGGPLYLKAQAESKAKECLGRMGDYLKWRLAQ